MRKELWKIMQDAYGEPYAEKDYNKEGLAVGVPLD